MLAVLRLSHRVFRDKRISTHLALTARAFGADEFYYTGEHDSHLEESVERMCNEWGGNTKVEHIESPWGFIEQWKNSGGTIVHLTMYGIDLTDKLFELKQKEKLLIVVGGVKVPGAIYELTDYNIAIGNQPHSEVAALGIFLDQISDSKARKKRFENAKNVITPSEDGKKMEKIE
ncbi:MAG: tRNA (cytidine(56)-2'-O)-methyltransferase [Candidatus Heimdallarchaeota archaeon]|nr:tRNA (cytidine(56)-2'-O)-methyltransferase [Candidatus Heimdallarchaeota archaeon]